MKLFFTFLVICYLSIGIANAQWTTSGPSGGAIYCNLHVGNDIYVGTSAGIYRSVDGGNTYKIRSTNLPRSQAKCLFFDSTTMYATFDYIQGIYISSDSGITWKLSNNSGYGKSFAIVNNKVFCLLTNRQVYFTTDHGKTWTLLFLPSNMYTGQVLPLFCAGKTLLKQVDNNSKYSLYRSVDEGLKWISSDSGLNSKEIVNIFSLYDTIYIFTTDRVYTSTNSGVLWKRMTNRSFRVPNGATFIPGIICFTGKKFYGTFRATSYPYVCTLEPGDTQWVCPIQSFPSGVTYALFTAGKHIFISRSSNLYSSPDSLMSWTIRDTTRLATMGVNAIGAVGNNIFAANGSVLYKSDNNGQNWKVNSTNSGVFIYSIAGFNNGLFLGTSNNGIVRSDNLGKDWKLTGLNKGFINIITNDGTNMYAAGSIVNNTSAYRSMDGGDQWDYFHSGWPSGNASDLAVADGYLFAALIGSGGAVPGIYKTPLSSVNWTLSIKGLPSAFTQCLAVKGNEIYTGTSGKGVYKSIDLGLNWTPENNGISRRSVLDLLTVGQNLYAASDSGVFVLYKGSNTWKDITFNIPASSMNRLSANSGNLFVSTNGASVWQIPLQRVGLNKYEKRSITFDLYPNPVDDNLTIGNVQLKMGDVLQIINMNGRVVERKMIDKVTVSVQFSIKHLVNGIYVMQLVSDGNLYTRKFVVQH